MKERLSKKYKMSDLGPAQQFLGIQIIRDRKARTIRIHQRPYIESILRKFQMNNCNGVSTPMEPNVQLENYDLQATQLERLEYQQAIGGTMYAMLGTRPDLAFTVSTLSKYCSNPSPIHAQAVQRVFRYLNKTLDVGITYGGSENNAISEAILQDSNVLGKGLTGLVTTAFESYGFTDSDWAGDKDSRKSTSGFLFTMYNGAISWKSTKQPIVATSSTEAEYIASTEAAKEAIWIRRIMAEIRGDPAIDSMEYSHENEPSIQLESLRITNSDLRSEKSRINPKPSANPSIIFADNQGAIKLSKNPQYHSRTKHIDVKYHFIRESCQNGLIKLIYIPTGEMVADILTKSLPRDKHYNHMKSMGLGTSGG